MTYILFNPLAGSRQGEVRAQALAKRMRGRDVTKLDAAAFLRGLPGTDMVILAGGDGALNHFANALRRRALPDDLLLPDRPGQRLHERRARERDERRRKIHSPAGGFIWAAPP